MSRPSEVPDDLGIPGVEGAVEIGVGGFGVVYRARQPALSRTVAVKVLNETLADDQARLRFDRECRAMGMLSGHPNIVTIFDSGVTAGGQPYLMMDFQPGGSYADILADGPLTPEVVTDVGVQCAGALATAHSAGILHRDLKPANVLRSRFGEPKVGDFGIARLQGAERTQTGVVTASFAHIPPEVVEGAPPSALTDIYSFGSTLFTLLAGHPPFAGDDGEDSITAIIGRVLIAQPPDLRSMGVPDPLARVIASCLAKSPGDRPQSMTELGRTLQGVQRELGLRVTALPVAESALPQATVDDSSTVVVDVGGRALVDAVASAQAADPAVSPAPSPGVGGGPATGADGARSKRAFGAVLIGGGALLVIAAVATLLLGGGDDPTPSTTTPPTVVADVSADDSPSPPASDEASSDAPSTPSDQADDGLLLVSDLPDGWTVDAGFASELQANPTAYLCAVAPDVPEPEQVAITAFRGGTPGPRVGHVVRQFAAGAGAAEAFMAAVDEQVACLLQDPSLEDVRRVVPTLATGRPAGDQAAAVSYSRPGGQGRLGIQLVFVRADDRVDELVQLAFPDVDDALTSRLVDSLR